MVKPSERLGNYEVATAADGSAMVLGSGAGGVTYCGRHIHLGTEVAIKVLIRRKNLLQKDRDAFLSEARSAASLTHPQIARILDFGESAQQHPYYVMELCEGGSLEEFGRKAGPPDEYACIQWFFESAAALAHAHQKGILHRDIKPSNLLVARQNEYASVKLIDFGLADHANHAESTEHVIGTPHFAAPEQLRGQAEPASDVFSLGATFLWLLTGKHLSQGDVKSVISDRLDAVSYAPLLTSLPATWQTLLGRMLDVDPTRRPRDGGEVLGALQAVFPNHPGHPVPWAASAEFPGAGARAPMPSQWEDFPDASWAERWKETSPPIPMDHGVAMTAVRVGAAESLDVLKFTGLDPEIAEILTQQGDLLAVHASELGLDRVILERGPDWHAVAWPALGTNDALSWVRQGKSAPIAEVLAALDPIATALDAMKPAGFEHIEIHPSMLIVRVAVPQKISHSATRDPRDLWEQETPGGTPLKFSLAVPLPVLASSDHSADSGGTMRGTTGAGLSARFASSVYQLLSGRTPAPAAFVNSRAYQAIPKLTEKSNRFLSSAIAGSIAGGSCRDVIRGLAHEERIPGASLTGSLSSSASAGSRSGASWQSSPPTSPPAHVPPPIPVAPPSAPAQSSPSIPATQPRPKPEVIAPAPTPKIAPVAGKLHERKKSPVLIISIIAAALILGMGSAAWIMVPKLLSAMKSTPPSEQSGTSGDSSEEQEPEVTPPDLPKVKDLVKVPEDAATINEALKVCKEGGTIEIASGTYSEIISLSKSVSLISKSGAVFEADGLGTSIVIARNPIEVKLHNIKIRNTEKEIKNNDASPPLVLIANGAKLDFVGCSIEGSLGDGVALTEEATATFSNCYLRDNNDNGIKLSGGSKVELSLSSIHNSGKSGIAAENLGTMVTLGNDAIISGNHGNGVELGKGAEFIGRGANIRANKKAGLAVDDGGSTARLEASCEISENQQGVGVRNSGRLVVADATFEDNHVDGIFVESGGQVDVTTSVFKSNGEAGIFLVNGSSSSVSVANSSFDNHPEAGVAIQQGKGMVTGCEFSNNSRAILYGVASSGSAIGNTVHPGPLEKSIDTKDAGDVTLRDNVVKAAE